VLWLMIKDELKHLWRNRFVRIVMICLPLMLPASLLAPAEDAAAMMAMAQMVFVQVSGLITGAVITASLVSDIQQGVPVLFAVRPQPRVYFLMARGAGMVVFLASGLLCGFGPMLRSVLWSVTVIVFFAKLMSHHFGLAASPLRSPRQG